jgi:electron transfer flavoprotein alpha subunit
MESILVLTHADETGAALTRGSLEAVTAGSELAAQLGAPLKIGIVAENPKPLAKGLPCPVLVVGGEPFAQPRYASDAAACEALCRAAQPTIALAPASSRCVRVTAGLAHRLGGVIDTHITAIANKEGLEVTRWFYRQRIEGTLRREGSPWFLLLDGDAYPQYACTSSEPVVEQISVALPQMRTTVIGIQSTSLGEQTIRPDAKLLFVAGAGWTKKQPDGQTHTAEAGELILNLLHHTHASLGSSKSLVDQGSDGASVLPFLTHMNQIGQTGATPRHPKGLSTCCHGEEPHVVGWRFIGERRAISLDPNCGWTRGKADVVYVADAFQVISRLNEVLAGRNS